MSNSSAIVNWDNIDSNPLHSAQSSMFPGYKETQVPCKKRRFAETAKVRFLPVEEAAKLKSGTRTTTLSTCNSSLNDGEPNGASDSMAKQGLELGLGMENGAGFSSAPRKELVHKGDTSDAFVSAAESEVSNGRKRHLDHNSASLPPIKPQLKGASPIHPEGSPTIKPNFHKNLSNVPALEAVWRGSFEVLDMDKVGSDMKLCEGFVAHAPAIVSRKAYEFSRQIAGVMQFKLHPCSNFGPEIFQAISPDVNDIALYFYPGKFERSRKKYSTLLKYIEKNDLVMRSQMGSVELFVFASKLLPLESQKLKNSFFMRRLFRHSKGK